MLTLGRFKALAESYGAEMQRWPEDLRADAVALLARSEPARRLLAEARVLDAAIAAAGAEAATALWQPGEETAAVARLRAGVAARLVKPRPVLPVPRGWFDWLPTRLGWVGMATGGGVAVVAGLLIGASYATAPAPGNVLAMLQPAPIQILAD